MDNQHNLQQMYQQFELSKQEIQLKYKAKTKKPQKSQIHAKCINRRQCQKIAQPQCKPVFNTFGLNFPSGSFVSSSVGVCGLLHTTALCNTTKCVIICPTNDNKIYGENTLL